MMKSAPIVVVHDTASAHWPWETLSLKGWAPAAAKGLSRLYAAEGIDITPQLVAEQILERLRIVEAGAGVGLRLAGLKALASLRMEKGYRDYGHDIDNTDNPFETGLGFFVDLNKADFIGRDAALQNRTPSRQRHEAFEDCMSPEFRLQSIATMIFLASAIATVLVSLFTRRRAPCGRTRTARSAATRST